jgi:hypothetical protein
MRKTWSTISAGFTSISVPIIKGVGTLPIEKITGTFNTPQLFNHSWRITGKAGQVTTR